MHETVAKFSDNTSYAISQMNVRLRMCNLSDGRSETYSVKYAVRLTAATMIALGVSHAAFADNDDRAAWRPDNAAAKSVTGPIIVERKSLEVGKARFSLRLDSSAADFKPGQDK